MAETSTITTITTIEEANADEAYVRVLPEALNLDGSMLNPITIDVMSVVITTMGVAKKIAPLEEELKKLYLFPSELLARFPDRILALYSAQTRYAFAAVPVAELPELLERATSWRDILAAEAKSLVARAKLNGDLLKELTGVHGYKNVAQDLAGLARIFKSHWSQIEGCSGLKQTDIAEVDKIALRLTGAVAKREQSPEKTAEATDVRLRMFTLVMRDYDEIRRAVQYLRWHDEDAEELAPSLYSGRQNSNLNRKSSSDNKAAIEEPQKSTVTTSAPAVKVAEGLPGSEPLSA
jgi:hypothetical protein